MDKYDRMLLSALLENGRASYADLARSHGPLKDEILRRLGELIDRSEFIGGPSVQGFEHAFAAHVGIRSATNPEAVSATVLPSRSLGFEIPALGQ